MSKINAGLAQATAYAIASMKKAKNWWLAPSTTQQVKKKTLAVEIDQSETSEIQKATRQEEGAKEIGTPGVPNTMPMFERVKSKIERAQQRVAEFENLSLEIHKQYKQTKIEMKRVKTKAYSMPVVRAFLIFKFQASPFYKNVKWRQGIEHLFSKFLDLLVIITYSSARIVKKTYNYLLADHIDQFVSDVRKKIEFMELEKDVDKIVEEDNTEIQKQE